MVERAFAVPLRRDEQELIQRIREHGRALVALSGGVDSAVVASLAFEALGGEVVAVTLSGPAVSSDEVARATNVARAIGIPHRVVRANPLENASYRANPSDRCYFCRAVETHRLREVGEEREVRQYLDGVHSDDLHDDRPGLRAMEEAGFEHPLVWGGWTKRDVRATARRRGLPNADEPSDACLASRIAHGDRIDEDLLARIEAAEAVVRQRGFRRVRVRTQGGAARIEVDPEEVRRLTEPSVAEELIPEIRALGFFPVTIDPRGYGAASHPTGAGA